jgi:hypothetical protein
MPEPYSITSIVRGGVDASRPGAAGYMAAK